MYDLPPSLLTRLHFYRTTAYPCSYLPGQTACSKVATPSHLINTQTFSDLLALGFRRSGIFTYRPDCDHCKACVPLRVPVADFQPARSQRRAHKQHANLITKVERLSFKPEHFALYQLYQRTRHPGGGMDQDSQQHYTEFLLQSGTQTVLVEFRDPNRPAQQDLVMVSIIDVLDHGLSAVYTFYTPEPDASYGTYNVLWQIQYAQALGLPYLYLGYWVEQSEKMHYKAQYRPHEIWQQGQWRQVSKTPSGHA